MVVYSCGLSSRKLTRSYSTVFCLARHQEVVTAPAVKLDILNISISKAFFFSLKRIERTPSDRHLHLPRYDQKNSPQLSQIIYFSLYQVSRYIVDYDIPQYI